MREYRSTGPLLILFLIGHSLLQQVAGQHTIKNVTLAGVDFSSPGYIDGLPYGVNSTRDYRFQTYYVNHTLKLEVVEFVLEYADKSGVCLYDRVVIYDGYNSSAPVLRILCGTIAAGTTYISTGNTVYVKFISDGSNTYKGFKMTVYSDGPTTTTSTTTTSTTPTSTTISFTTTASPPTTTSVAAATTISPILSTLIVTSATLNGGTNSKTSTGASAVATAMSPTISVSNVSSTESNVGNTGNTNQTSDGQHSNAAEKTPCEERSRHDILVDYQIQYFKGQVEKQALEKELLQIKLKLLKATEKTVKGIIAKELLNMMTEL